METGTDLSEMPLWILVSYQCFCHNGKPVISEQICYPSSFRRAGFCFLLSLIPPHHCAEKSENVWGYHNLVIPKSHLLRLCKPLTATGCTVTFCFTSLNSKHWLFSVFDHSPLPVLIPWWNTSKPGSVYHSPCSLCTQMGLICTPLKRVI